MGWGGNLIHSRTQSLQLIDFDSVVHRQLVTFEQYHVLESFRLKATRSNLGPIYPSHATDGKINDKYFRNYRDPGSGLLQISPARRQSIGETFLSIDRNRNGFMITGTTSLIADGIIKAYFYLSMTS